MDIEKEYYKKLIKLYKGFFEKHNLFFEDESKIISYLRAQNEDNELIVSQNGDEIDGALFIELTSETPDGSHSLWKLRHFAFASDVIGKYLLSEAEKKIKKASKSAKIEVHVAESEKHVKFYTSNDFVKEGELKNHYRAGEIMFIFGKNL